MIHPNGPAGDTDDIRFPYTFNDNKGSILCFHNSVVYISGSHLRVTILQEKVNPTQAAFSLESHHASMYENAVCMRQRAHRFDLQCCIWMLHMLLSDLNTVLIQSPKGSLKKLAALFIPVISNMTRNCTIPQPSMMPAWVASVLNRTAVPAADTSTLQRESAKDLLYRLETMGAIAELARVIGRSTIEKSRFFHCNSSNLVHTAVSAAAEAVWETSYQIVTTKDSGVLRLRYTVND